MNKINALIPVNEKFIEVFEIFMDDEQKIKIRANQVRQYTEGLIDLLLREKIQEHLKANEDYTSINWSRKLKIIRNFYDADIADKFDEIFHIGGDGSHFNGNVNKEQLQEIINNATHIIEDIFVKYFTNDMHKFGTENIYTIFSMLPLKNRIYILEHITVKYTNESIVDRLSLAYFKNGEKDKAFQLIDDAYNNGIISIEAQRWFRHKISLLEENLSKLYKMNATYSNQLEQVKAIFQEGCLVVGMPTSEDIFDTAKAYDTFNEWFQNCQKQYPEFISIFMCLMARDERKYI